MGQPGRVVTRRRTWGHVGSRLFTLVFVAIFVLILVQVVIGGALVFATGVLIGSS